MRPFTLQQPSQEKQPLSDIAIFEQHHVNGEATFPDYHTIKLNAAKVPNESYEYSDNRGDNISSKNLTYVDLTGVYWIWKNVHDYRYKGNVHYKRFYTTDSGEILRPDEILELLKGRDCIIPQCARLEGRTVYQIFNDFHGHENMDECRKVIAETARYYLGDFDDVVMNGEYSTLFNMMVAESQVFDAYCVWLFSILFELEDRLRKKGVLEGLTEEDYQRKIFGFIGERLLLVWLKHNNIKYLEVPYTVFHNGLTA